MLVHCNGPWPPTGSSEWWRTALPPPKKTTCSVQEWMDDWQPECKCVLRVNNEINVILLGWVKILLGTAEADGKVVAYVLKIFNHNLLWVSWNLNVRCHSGPNWWPKTCIHTIFKHQHFKGAMMDDAFYKFNVPKLLEHTTDSPDGSSSPLNTPGDVNVKHTAF